MKHLRVVELILKYENKFEINKRENRREQATQELINTEAQYNILLALLVKHYVEPLKDYKTITSDQHTKLFPQLQSIKELSDNFLAALQQRRTKWDSNNTKLSDLFDIYIFECTKIILIIVQILLNY